jgi:hypothetical protein
MTWKEGEVTWQGCPRFDQPVRSFVAAVNFPCADWEVVGLFGLSI